MMVNKRQLSVVLGISLPTLQRWMQKYEGDFPVETYGRKGRDWLFDSEKVSTFVADLRARERLAEENRLKHFEELKREFRPMGGMRSGS